MFFFSFLNLWQYVQSLRTYGNVDFVVSNKTFVDTTHYCSLLFLSHFFCILFSTRKFDLVFFTNGNIILQSRITIFQILWKSRCHILVTFLFHLKKITLYTEIFWHEKLNCGFFHWFHSRKSSTKKFRKNLSK